MKGWVSRSLRRCAEYVRQALETLRQGLLFIGRLAQRAIIWLLNHFVIPMFIAGLGAGGAGALITNQYLVQETDSLEANTIALQDYATAVEENTASVVALNESIDSVITDSGSVRLPNEIVTTITKEQLEYIEKLFVEYRERPPNMREIVSMICECTKDQRPPLTLPATTRGSAGATALVPSEGCNPYIVPELPGSDGTTGYKVVFPNGCRP